MILEKIYSILPKALISRLRSNDVAVKTLNLLFKKKNGDFREVKVEIDKLYYGQKVKFDFYAALKTASKAKKTGLESKLLNLIFKINEQFYLGQRNWVIIDVGANFGYLSSVWAQTLASEGGKVYAIEPSPHVFESFKKTIMNNEKLNKNIQPINMAAGNKDGAIELFLNGGTSNTLESKNAVKSVSIPINKLDSICSKYRIKSLDMIKIDVDGIELEILKGASNVIDQYKPLLVVETNSDRQILDYCVNKGYTIFDMDFKFVDLGVSIVPENIFCITKKETNLNQP